LTPTPLWHYQPRMTKILIAVPHAGVALPESVATQFCAHVDAPFLLAQSDAFTDQIYGLAGVPTHVFGWSRFVCDPNRFPDQVGAGGVVPRQDFDRRALYPHGGTPDDDEVERRLAAFYHPYHDRLAERLLAEGVRLFIDGHSMAQTAPPRSPDAGKARPDVILGNCGGPVGARGGEKVITCPPEFLWAARGALLEAFAACAAPAVPGSLEPRRSVDLNTTFSGGYGVQRHGVRHPRRFGLQVELNQGLWCCPSTFALYPGRIAWIGEVLQRWCGALDRLFV
jgi:N-formylglutamate amidohydrolase